MPTIAFHGLTYFAMSVIYMVVALVFSDQIKKTCDKRLWLIAGTSVALTLALLVLMFYDLTRLVLSA